MMKKCMLGFLIATCGISVYATDCYDKTCYTSCCKSGCCPTEYSKPCGDCSLEATSKTYFSARPLYQSVRPELTSGFRNERALARENGKGGALDLVLFGGGSTQGKQLASYFMPNGKTTLSVSGKSSPEFTPDLYAKNFGLDEVYTGTICFQASQSAIGLGLHYKQRFAWTEDETRGWWFSASTPIQRVSNKITLYENSNSADIVTEPNGEQTPVTSMCQAFNQPTWNFGRIAANTAMRKTRLADIEAKVGYEWLICDGCHLASYFGALIPTGNKPTGRYLFEPIVGHGKHFGALWGAEGGFRIWEQEEKDRSISVEYAMHSQYLFQNTQCRSFDLKNNPWSRYLLMYANYEDGIADKKTPGINVLTRSVKVTPRFSHNLTTAFVFTSGGFQGEIGANIFCRQAECVKLDCPWPTDGNAPALAGESKKSINPFQTIKHESVLQGEPISVDIADNSEIYNKHAIKSTDLDLHSATHPAILSYMFHGAIGYRWDDREFPVHLSAGGSYEFANKVNTVLNRWTVWSKVGFAF